MGVAASQFKPRPSQWVQILSDVYRIHLMVSRIFCHYDFFFQIAKFVYLFLCTFNIGTTFIFVDRIRRFVVTEYLMNRIEQGKLQEASGSLSLDRSIVIFVSLPTFSDQYNLYVFLKYSHQCFVKTILSRNFPDNV